MFGCPSIGNVFRPSGGGSNIDPDNGNEIVEPPRNPPKSRTPLAFLRDRGAASIGALRGRKSSTGTTTSAVSTEVRGSTNTIRSNASSATASAVIVTPPASSTPDPMTPVRTASGSQTMGRTNSDNVSTPPTPPPISPPRPISIPVTLPGPRPGVTSRPTRTNARATPPFGTFMAPRMPAVRVGPIDEDGYSDMILPCGLYQEEVIDIMYRDLSPEDFEALSKLDERLPKRNTAGRSLVDRLPRMPAGECGVTECGVCLAELASHAMVVKLPCGHAFHPNCISKWLTQCKNTCPFCTAPIQPSSSVSTCGTSSNTTRAV